MEHINTIEKITLIASTTIVFLANLFVLLESTKKNKKRKTYNVGQIWLSSKNVFFTVVLISTMSSCSGSKFLNRKYTSGRFATHLKIVKHNTVYTDTTKKYASVNNEIVLGKALISLNNNTEKEIIDNKVSSILKKDSIWISKRKGRDRRIVKRDKFEKVVIIAIKPEEFSIDNLPKLEKAYYKSTEPVTTHIKKKGKDRYVTISEKGDTTVCKNMKPIYKIKDEKLKKLAVDSCNKVSYKAMSWSILSFVGIVLSTTALCKIRKTKRKYENVNLKEARTIAFVSLAISILTTLCFLAITALIINYLGSGIGAAVTPAR